VTDAGSGLLALVWWLLTPLIALWSIIVGFVFASPPQLYSSEESPGTAGPPQQRGVSSHSTASDTSVRRRAPGYVSFYLCDL